MLPCCISIKSKVGLVLQFGPGTINRLSLSGGLAAPFPLSCASKIPVSPTKPGTLLFVMVPLAKAVFGETTARQSMSMWTTAPKAGLWTSAWPATFPLGCRIALKEKVLRSPLTMKSPLPVAERGLATETPGTKPRATSVNANKPARKTVRVVMMITSFIRLY